MPKRTKKKKGTCTIFSNTVHQCVTVHSHVGAFWVPSIVKFHVHTVIHRNTSVNTALMPG